MEQKQVKNGQEAEDDDQDVISFKGSNEWRIRLGSKTSWFKSLVAILTGSGMFIFLWKALEQFVKLWEKP